MKFEPWQLHDGPVILVQPDTPRSYFDSRRGRAVYLGMVTLLVERN
jgi:hypothetical protein